jgi:hypothetical protein
MHPIQMGGSVQQLYCDTECLLRSVNGQQLQTAQPVTDNTRGDCKHLGPKRRCCDRLHICRLHGNCVTELPETDGVKCCSTCDTFESTGPSL